jgi:hypothetical protein
MENSSPTYSKKLSSLLRGHRRALFLGSLCLLLLTLTISVVRHPSFLTLFGLAAPSPVAVPQVDALDDPDLEFMRVAALASEETTSGKFRSGGLGLSRTAWEVLHGTAESTNPDTLIYQDNSYKVTYQQNLVWQIEKSWGKSSPAAQQARTRIRRYLPLDSHLTETIEKSADTIVDVYRSHMLAQLLSPQPPSPPAKKRKRRLKDLPTERCVVVHQLNKQKVTSSLLHIGAPRPEGYLPPQSQTVPTTTLVNKEPGRKEPGRSDLLKTTSPSGRAQRQS